MSRESRPAARGADRAQEKPSGRAASDSFPPVGRSRNPEPAIERIDFAGVMRPVALALLGKPNARLSTVREWRYRTHGSLVVHVDGEYSGTFRDHEADAGGGVLALVVRERGGTEREAMAWLRDAGLLDGAGGLRADNELAGRDAPSKGRCAPAPSSKPRDTTGAARRVWEATRPLAGTIAERYLLARGAGHVAVAPSLRFSPALTHPQAPGRFPCLVAGVQDVHGGFLAVHRIYLDRAGAGKANVDPVKASLGSTAGGAVRLAEPSGGPLLVGEGIESTAAAMVLFDLPGFAAIGTGGLTAIELPEHVRDVVIAADKDFDGAGQLAAAALAERLQAEGREVEIQLPPFIGDWNDVLLLAREAT